MKVNVWIENYVRLDERFIDFMMNDAHFDIEMLITNYEQQHSTWAQSRHQALNSQYTFLGLIEFLNILSFTFLIQFCELHSLGNKKSQ